MEEVFVIDPLSEECRAAYEIVSQAVLKAGAVAFRLHELTGPSLIEETYDAIEKADVIICDVSTTNPNVMYELGYAHALRKPLIVISKALEQLPFELGGIPFLRYDMSSTRGTNVFANEIGAMLSEALNNPWALVSVRRKRFPSLEAGHALHSLEMLIGTSVIATDGEIGSVCKLPFQ